MPVQRQRRASMQDAIDLKKIDAKLYDRKVRHGAMNYIYSILFWSILFKGLLILEKESLKRLHGPRFEQYAMPFIKNGFFPFRSSSQLLDWLKF